MMINIHNNIVFSGCDQCGMSYGGSSSSAMILNDQRGARATLAQTMGNKILIIFQLRIQITSILF